MASPQMILICASAFLTEFFADAVNMNSPFSASVPVMMPVLESSVSPAGSCFAENSSGLVPLTGKGEFNFTASAKNSAGKAKAEIKIICGDTLALTPPLGWNSYDAFGDNVVESEVLANA